MIYINIISIFDDKKIEKKIIIEYNMQNFYTKLNLYENDFKSMINGIKNIRL